MITVFRTASDRSQPIDCHLDIRSLLLACNFRPISPPGSFILPISCNHRGQLQHDFLHLISSLIKLSGSAAKIPKIRASPFAAASPNCQYGSDSQGRRLHRQSYWKLYIWAHIPSRGQWSCMLGTTYVFTFINWSVNRRKRFPTPGSCARFELELQPFLQCEFDILMT